MRTKAGLLLTAFAFLLVSAATGVAQQNPAAGGNAAGRPAQPAGGGQSPGGQGPGGQGGGRGQQPPPFAMMSTSLIVHDMEPRPRKGLDDILHWMVWNIAPTATQIPEAIPGDTQQLPDGSVQTNGNPGQGGNLGYRPPCPPAGPSHHYAFELFALDQKLDVPGTATRADVLKAMDGHILAHAALIAPYHQ
jgi:Raf kinase inhibitor-like YbhB/YbcL family protein